MRQQMRVVPGEVLPEAGEDVRYNRGMTAEVSGARLPFAAAVIIWAGMVIAAGFGGAWLGYGGRSFAIALATAALLFGFEFFLAVPRVQQIARGRLAGSLALLAPLVPVFAVIVYSLGVTGNMRLMAAGIAYAFAPSLLAARAREKPAGAWEDYLAVVIVWLPVEFRWMYRVFPYPQQLTHTLTILFALSTGIAAFLLVRRLDSIGYAITWRRGFSANVVLHLAIFAAIAIPLGEKMGFLHGSASPDRMQSLPISIAGILFFTAWPEEFLFRGLLQNSLSRTLHSEWIGLVAASLIFGFSHILHGFPNWKYVLLATIAGLFYGHAWMRSRSLVPGTLIHGCVDILWHVLFH